MTEKKGSVNPFVSVILPCYNCEKYIAEALGSLLRQDCTDFEILCIDDGSTDDTWSQLLRFAERAGTLRPEISLRLFPGGEPGRKRCQEPWPLPRAGEIYPVPRRG